MSEPGLNRAYLSLGSNIEPERNLPAAARLLSGLGHVLAVSRVWESAPFGSFGSSDAAPAGNFLNGAILFETERTAESICSEVVPTVESRLGRVRDPRDKSAPRTIDVDLSLFNRDVLAVGHRQIPDPDVLLRAFVAVPLADLDPDYLHPIVRRKLAEIAADLAAMQPLHYRPDVVLGGAGLA